mmetsp:Transcript_48870/g.147253  ORF Transcript_48870/g.147253 Transcript_48870/m.147253 type:complete len:98 (-) Transcript_48870:95-388(-)
MLAKWAVSSPKADAHSRTSAMAASSSGVVSGAAADRGGNENARDCGAEGTNAAADAEVERERRASAVKVFMVSYDIESLSTRADDVSPLRQFDWLIS